MDALKKCATCNTEPPCVCVGRKWLHDMCVEEAAARQRIWDAAAVGVLLSMLLFAAAMVGWAL